MFRSLLTALSTPVPIDRFTSPFNFFSIRNDTILNFGRSAYVEFTSEDAVESALALNDTALLSRNLKVCILCLIAPIFLP